MIESVNHEKLNEANLLLDAVYESGSDGKLSGEPISKMSPGSGNMGDFRFSGRGSQKNWVNLFMTGEDRDWPDTLNTATGQFIYCGDNRTPGHELHQTPIGGNKELRPAFESFHAAESPRAEIAPFFILLKHATPTESRSVRFKGLAAPGYSGLSQTEDLVAVWKTTDGQRFQNYRSIFTVLDIAIVSRDWIDDLAAGNKLSENAPNAWRERVDTGKYSPLMSEPTTTIPSVEEQTCDNALKSSILRRVWQHFAEAPIAFEAFAAFEYQLTDQRVIVDGITRGVIDGGRDAYGRYLLGIHDDPVHAEFSLEVKDYRPPGQGSQPNTVGVKEVSRLISRIRHRQFGVLVTTSVIARQAYQEVREDRDPIIFIFGRDIAEILIKSGYNTPENVQKLLNDEFSAYG